MSERVPCLAAIFQIQIPIWWRMSYFRGPVERAPPAR